MLSTDNSRTRQRSLQAALEVVQEEGLERLTTRAIARRSGLTQPAIYRHFEGVDELAQETLGLIRDKFLCRLKLSEGLAAPRDRLISGVEAFRQFAVEYPRLYDALFLRTSADSPALRAAASPREGSIFGVLVQRVEEWAADVDIHSTGPVSMALSLAAHAQGLILFYKQGRFGSKERFADTYRRSINALLRGYGDREVPIEHD